MRKHSKFKVTCRTPSSSYFNEYTEESKSTLVNEMQQVEDEGMDASVSPVVERESQGQAEVPTVAKKKTL